jgi:hypothetical protein
MFGYAVVTPWLLALEVADAFNGVRTDVVFHGSDDGDLRGEYRGRDGVRKDSQSGGGDLTTKTPRHKDFVSWCLCGDTPV